MLKKQVNLRDSPRRNLKKCVRTCNANLSCCAEAHHVNVLFELQTWELLNFA